MNRWDAFQSINVVAFGLHLHNWLNGRAPLWSFSFTIVGMAICYSQQRRRARQQAEPSRPPQE